MGTRKLTIERRDTETDTLITLKGIIDEDAHFEGVFTKLKPTVHVDLEGVQTINSSGVRSLTAVQKEMLTGVRLKFEKCSPSIVNQLNLISNFMAPAEIVSFYAAYVCPKCESETKILFSVQDLKKGGSDPAASKNCPACQGAMELDEPLNYFDFLND